MSDFIFSTTKSGTTSLYESNGTAAGTNSLGVDLVSQPSDFTTFDNKLFFVGTEPLGTGPAGGSLQPLFSTNGTPTGTVQLQDSPGVLYPDNVNVVNGKLLVSGEQFISGNGIDISSNGVDFTQINNSISAKPNSFAVSNGIGFFDAVSDLGTGSNHGLWRTDGTATGTFSINPTGVTLAPSGFTAVGGNTVFVNASANGADGTGTLWVTNGTSAGTHQIVDSALGAEVAPGSAVTNGKAIFTAQDAAGRQSIWATNGTSAGTTEILVLGPAGAPIRHSSGFTAFNGKVIYTTGYDVAITDGTAAGTVSLPTGSPMSYVTVGSKIFTAAIAGSGPTLSVSDGTPAGTAALKISGLVSINSPLKVVGSDVIFEGTDTSGKQGLFESDGTATGSKELTLPAGITVEASTVIAALPASTTNPSPFIKISNLVEDGGRLLMSGDKEVGTPAGIREYMDGKYIGVLRENFADGAFSMHINDVVAGSHVLLLTLNRTSATASYSFIKHADGGVTQNVATASAAGFVSSLLQDHNTASAHA